MKTCTKCGQTKEDGLFSFKKSGLPVLRAACKKCSNTPRTEERKIKAARYRKTQRELYPERERRRYLKIYGTTPEWYDAQLEKQGGGCGICHKKTDETGTNFAVDHDHLCCPKVPVCGECNRGLLCRSCNVGIGNLDDSADLLRDAANYIDKYTPRAVCLTTGYSVELTRKLFRQHGTPKCPCCDQSMTEVPTKTKETK